MSQAQTPHARLEPEPLPDNLTSVQPGGGVCYRIELAWGRWRRWYLRTFRSGYLRRMAELRRGSPVGAPHEILDPRDLKYCRNRVECDWPAAVDPFAWRDRLPFARWGLCELQVMSYPLIALSVVLVLWLHWSLALLPGLLVLFVLYFFRNPRRSVPQMSDLLVSPADGTIAEVARLDHDDFIGGPAVRIGIFLSVFNVHINCAPAAARVIRLRYSPGLFLNALKAESTIKNEALWIGLEEDAPPYRRLVVRQIAGLIARRIVCNLRSGERVARGHKFGMIKLGSRTELICPDEPGLEVLVTVGQAVQGGHTVLARYGAGASVT